MLLRNQLMILFIAALTPTLVACGIIVYRPYSVIANPTLSWIGSTLAVVAGFLIVMTGVQLLITKPLQDLNTSIRRWEVNTSYLSSSHQQLSPIEIKELLNSFRCATIALERHRAEMRAAIEQQEMLMQEVHHRVKNNLQVVASLMNLQASRIRQPEAKAEFQSARDRIRALATLHRHLYAQGKLHTINMRSFLVELCEQLFQAVGEDVGNRIKLKIEAPELQMLSDQAVPMSLIVTEAVSNAIKYAFPDGRQGSISVHLLCDGDDAELSVIDDGVGMPQGRMDMENGSRDGIGIILIRGFARQLGATLTVEEGGGTRYFVRMTLRPVDKTWNQSSSTPI